MSSAIVLVSGGLDSTVLLHHIKKSFVDVIGLSFFYGQRHQLELSFAEQQCLLAGVPWERIDLRGVIRPTGSALTGGKEVPTAKEVEGDPQPVSYVPFRNTIFLSITMSLAEAGGVDHIFYGAQQRDFGGYWDCTREYLKRLQTVANLNRRHKIALRAPFMNWKRFLIVQEGVKLGVDFSKTHSCYKGERPPCGTCPSCDERRLAFEKAGVEDPLTELAK